MRDGWIALDLLTGEVARAEMQHSTLNVWMRHFWPRDRVHNLQKRCRMEQMAVLGLHDGLSHRGTAAT